MPFLDIQRRKADTTQKEKKEHVLVINQNTITQTQRPHHHANISKWLDILINTQKAVKIAYQNLGGQCQDHSLESTKTPKG